MEKSLQQQASDCLRIVIYGPESTGKTTLAKALAKDYQTQWVPEFARAYLQQKWDDTQEVCNKEDLLQIVKGQLAAENHALTTAKGLLFCDTNVLVTQVWSETHFEGYCDPKIRTCADTFHYDHYLLTDIDVPWKADDLRDRPQERKTMFDAFKALLVEKKVSYTLITGATEARMVQAKNAINNLK